MQRSVNTRRTAGVLASAVIVAGLALLASARAMITAEADELRQTNAAAGSGAAEPRPSDVPATAVRLPEIIAHRGASYEAPENTLAAIRLAWQQGADAVEVDARLSRDGRIVLMHDATTRRTTGLDARVANLTLAELEALDAGSWMGPQWAGERVPALAEALASVSEGRRVFIDLKVGREIVPELVRVLRASELPPAQTAVIGSSLPVLEAARRALPGVSVYWLVSMRQHPETGRWLPPLSSRIRRARASGLDGLDFRMADAIDAAFVDETRQAGLAFYVWTVNTPDEADQARRAGVDGITTDRPGWLRERLRDEPPSDSVAAPR